MVVADLAVTLSYIHSIYLLIGTYPYHPMTELVGESSETRTMLRKFRRKQEKLTQFKATGKTIRRTTSGDFKDLVSSAKLKSIVRSASADPSSFQAARKHNRSVAFCRGEGVRTVVLARTKKGYGFVLRGAKGELYEYGI